MGRGNGSFRHLDLTIAGRRDKAASRPRDRRRGRLLLAALEVLENRTLLVTGGGPPLPGLAAIYEGNLVVAGTPDSTITVNALDPSNATVTITGPNEPGSPYSNTLSIPFGGGIVVNEATGTNVVEVTGIVNVTLKSGGGSDTDTINLTGDSDGALVVNGLSGSNTVTLGASQATLTNSGAVESVAYTEVPNLAISTPGGSQSYTGAVVLGASTSVSADSVSFGATVDDSSALTDSLTIDAEDSGGDTGDVTFTGDVGDTAAPAALTIVNAADVNAAKINVGSFTQDAGTGATLLAGPLLTSGAGVNLSTYNVTVSNGITIKPGSGGAIAITTTGTLDMNLGVIALDSGDLTIDDAGTSDLITSIINGAGGLVKEGTGVLADNSESDYTGATTVSAGTLQLGPGGVLGTTSGVTVNGGVLDLNGQNVSIPALNGDGGVILNDGTANSTLTVRDGGSYSGTIEDNDNAGPRTLGVTFNASGQTLALLGTDTYSGATTISAGTLQVDGALTGDGNVTVSSGGRLDGLGSVTGSITVENGGNLQAGDGGPGLLTTRGVVFDSGSNFNVVVHGDTPGPYVADYGQLVLAASPPDLSGATLNVLDATYAPTPGSVIDLIQNVAYDPMIGGPSLNPITTRFSGLPDGSTVTVDGVAMILSYEGGPTGQDVTLTAPGSFTDTEPATDTGTHSFTIQEAGTGAGTTVQLLEDGAFVDSRPVSSVVGGYTIDSQAGVNAALVVAGYFTVPGGLTFNGGGTDTTSSLTLNTGSVEDLSYDATGANAGTLVLNENPGLISPDQISFSGLSSIINNTPAENVSLTVGDSLLQTVAITSVAGTDEASFDGGLELPFGEPGQLSIHGNGDNDTVEFDSPASAFDGGLTIDTLGTAGVVTVETSLDVYGPVAITAGTINLDAPSIVTNYESLPASSVTLSGPVTLGTDVSIDTATTNSGAIEFGDVITGGGHSLTLNSGNALTTVTGALSGVATLTIANSAGTTFAGAVSATTATLTNTTGTIAFEGGLSLTTLNTAAQGDSVAITGATNTVTNAVTFLNTGTVTLGQAAGATTFTNGINTTSGPSGTSLAGTIATTDAALTLDATTLSAATTLNSGGGNVRIASLAGGGHNLTLAAGSGAGTITVLGAVTNLGGGTGAALTVAAGVTGLVRFEGTLGANSGLVASAANSLLEFDGDVTLAAGDTASALDGDVTLSGGLTFQSAVSVTFGTSSANTLTLLGGATSVTITGPGNGLTINATVAGNSNGLTLGAAGAVALNAALENLGATVLTNGGLLTIASGATIGAASVSQNGAGAVASDANITTTGGNVGFATGVTLDGPLTISTGAGNVTFGGTIDGDYALTIDSGGVTTFDGTVGGVTPLASVLTDAPGATDIGASMTTCGGMTFNDPVYLLATVTLTDLGTSGPGITFNSTIDSSGTTPYGLTVASNNPKTFNAPIGSQYPLSSLTTEVANSSLPAAPTLMNAGTVTTTGDQNYTDNVELVSSTAFNSGGPTTVTGTLTEAPGSTASLTVVGGPGTTVINCSTVDVNLTVDASSGEVLLGLAENTVTITSTATGEGGGSNDAFSSDQGGSVNGPTSILSLISGGGYNTIDLTQTPIGAWLDLNENDGQSQPIYNQALNNPNIEEQGPIENFSATEYTTLQNSTVSLEGSFQAVIGGSNDILYAAPSTAAQSGSFILLDGGNNTVYGAPGSNIVSFSGTNQVVQGTTSDQDALDTAYSDASGEANGFLGSDKAGLPAFIGPKAPGIVAFLAGKTAGIPGFLNSKVSGSPAFLGTGDDTSDLTGFITSKTGGVPAFMEQDGPGVSAYLSQSGTLMSFLDDDLPGITAFLTSKTAGNPAFLGGKVAGSSAFLLQNGLALGPYILSNTTAETYLAQNINDVSTYITSDPAVMNAYFAYDHAAGTAYQSGLAALQTYMGGTGLANLTAFLTQTSMAGLTADLTTSASDESAFVTQNAGAIAQYILSQPADLAAFLNQEESGMAAFIANNDSQAFLQQDLPGVVSYILQSSDAVSALLAADSYALQAFASGGGSALSEYLNTDPSDFNTYIASNPGVLTQYIAGNAGALSQFTANDPADFLLYASGYTTSSPTALLNFLNTNAGVLPAYLSSTTYLTQFIASEPSSVGLFLTDGGISTATFLTYIEGDPQILEQFLEDSSTAADTAGIVQDYLSDTAQLAQYLSTDPQVLANFLETSTGAEDLATWLELPGNAGLLQQFLNTEVVNLFRLNVNLSGTGNEVIGGLNSTFNIGTGSFTEAITPDQVQMVETGINETDPPPLSAYDLDVTMASGPNVIVGGLLGDFTTLGGNTQFVIEDPSLLGLPTGTAVPSDIIGAAGAGGIFNGGGGNDTFYFVGGGSNNIFGHVVLTEPSGSAVDTLDFSNFQAGGITLNLNTVTEQEVSLGNLWLTLPADQGITDVIGSPFSDTITANNLNDNISGAAEDISHPEDEPGPANPTYQVQWVYLDFNDYYTNLASYETLSASDPGGQYTEAEQESVLQGLESIYAVFSTLVKFSLTPPTTEEAPDGYETIFFNRTPIANASGVAVPVATPGPIAASIPTNGMAQPGGISSQIDFDNESLTDVVNLDVNGFLGDGLGQVADTPSDFLNLTIDIAAHELGHTLGAEHQDSFGPIGFGITNPPSNFNPTYPGLVGAFQTDNDIMASPASVGSTIADAASGLANIGERTAIILAFIEDGTTITGSDPSSQDQPSVDLNGASTATTVAAEPVSATGGLYTLNVPNPITTGFDAGKTFDVAAVAINGALQPGAPVPGEYELNADGSEVLNNGSPVPLDAPTASDFYTFSGQAGDLMNFQVMSEALSRISDPFDSVLLVYGPKGNLVAWNDDDFESSDSSIVDLTLPCTGTYTVEVSSFQASQMATLEALTTAQITSLITPSSPNYDPADYYGTGSGQYVLLIYRFNAYNATNGTDTVQINGQGSFSVNGNAIVGPAGNTITLAGIQQAVLTDTGPGGQSFTITTGWTGSLTVDGTSGKDDLIVTGTLSGQTTVASPLALVSIGQDLAGTLVTQNVVQATITGSILCTGQFIAGGACAPATVGSLNIGKDLDGTLTVTGTLTAATVGGNVCGTVGVNGTGDVIGTVGTFGVTGNVTTTGTFTVCGNAGALNIGGNLSGTVSVSGTTGALSVGGTVANTAVVSAGNLTEMTVGPNLFSAGHDMAGQIIVSSAGLLGDLRVAGGTPGTIVAGKVGTIRVYGGYGPVALQVDEDGVERDLEVTPPGATAPVPVAPPNPAPAASPSGITFEWVYEGLGSPLGLTNAQLSLRVRNATGSSAPNQFDISLVTPNDLSQFNLARLDATGVSGVRDVAIDGDLLATISPAAESFLGLTTLAGGVALPLDSLGGVGVRDYAAPSSIQAKSVQALAFGEYSLSGKVVSNSSTQLASAQNAYTVLTSSTTRALSSTTYLFPFGQYPVIAYLTTTTNNVFDPNYVLFTNESASDPDAAAENLPANASVTAAVTVTASGTKSNVTGIALTGDDGSFQTAQWVNGPITSTGPLGDVTLTATNGITGTITAPRIFGSITAPDGPIAATAIIQTTGQRIDPITGAVTTIPADFGQDYYNATTKAWTDTTVSGTTTIAGEIISRGDLLSQVTTTGTLTGLVAAQGNIGGYGTATGQPSLFGGVAVTGTMGGQIFTLGCIIGNVALTNLVSGKVAAAGGILGNLTVTGMIDPNSAIVSGGAIGSTALGTKLTVSGANLGFIAAQGVINSGTAKLTGSVFNNVGTAPTNVNAAAIEALFAESAPVLSAADQFDQATLLDLVNLKAMLTKLKALKVTGGNL